MIKKVTIENFKCFEKLDMEFSNLNVLAGVNSMGKSTVIQVLLLLRQAYEKGAINQGVYLNGELINIGTGHDLLYRFSNKDVISISVNDEKSLFEWEYEYEKKADFLRAKHCTVDLPILKQSNLFDEGFAYVAADRIGPQRYYSSSHYEIYGQNKVGNQGEFFAGYLAERGKEEKVTNDKVLHSECVSQALENQTAAWLSEISPGIHLNPRKYEEAGLVGMEYTVDNENYSPLNMGFGISYVAPIVLALLKAKPGSLIILENPEAHLHPQGQRKMGELIAKAAAGGVQVIVETHSDHLLNGIRLAVKNNILASEKVYLNFFFVELDATAGSGNHFVHKKSTPCILKDGSLSSWPDGFFDEWDKALEELI